ncbi:MAG: hypothetical protein ACE5D0_07640 [Fidelibacterota bacterium]
MKHIFKLLMITFLISSITFVYAQDDMDKTKDEIVKEKSKGIANQEPSDRLAKKVAAPSKKLSQDGDVKTKSKEQPTEEKMVPASLSSKAVAPSVTKSASAPTAESLKAAPSVETKKDDLKSDEIKKADEDKMP